MKEIITETPDKGEIKRKIFNKSQKDKETLKQQQENIEEEKEKRKVLFKKYGISYPIS